MPTVGGSSRFLEDITPMAKTDKVNASPVIAKLSAVPRCKNITSIDLSDCEYVRKISRRKDDEMILT